MRRMNLFDRLLIKLASKVISRYKAVSLTNGTRVVFGGNTFIITRSDHSQSTTKGTSFSMEGITEFDYYLINKRR